MALALIGAGAFAQEQNPEYGIKQTGFASAPKFGAYYIGSYKYSSQDGANNGPGFNTRLIRAYVDGSLFTDFKYRVQVELNGTPHVKDATLEWAKYKEFSVKVGQFKRAFTFENPYNPWDVGNGDYSLAVKKLAGMGDYCGEKSMGGRDQGIQFQGDLFPIGQDKHRLVHYQLGFYNGNGINQADNNKEKDIIGTIQLQPIKDLYIGVFGWNGTYTQDGVTVDRKRYAVSGKYEHNNWTARAEYVHANGHRIADYNALLNTWSGAGEADAFYAIVGVPVNDWFKLYVKYDTYRQQATADTQQTIYSVVPNFRLHKNLNFQVEYRYNDNKLIANPDNQKYHELWFQWYVRF